MKTITTTLPAAQVVELLLGGIEAENMRVVAHINGQANAAKMGKEVPADQILEALDAVVHLAGENIAAGRWTKARMASIRASPQRLHREEPHGRRLKT